MQVRTGPSAKTVLIALVLCTAAICAGAIHGRTMQAYEPPEASIEGCTQWYQDAFEGSCPDGDVPQREDPWAPTVIIGPPPTELNCQNVKVFLSGLFLAECPIVGEPSIAPWTSEPQPILVTKFSEGDPDRKLSFSLTPDFGDDELGDITPHSYCIPMSDFVGEVTYLIDHLYAGKVLLDRGNLHVYCCDDC